MPLFFLLYFRTAHAKLNGRACSIDILDVHRNVIIDIYSTSTAWS